MRVAAVLALLLGSVPCVAGKAPPVDSLELWLARGPDCNACRSYAAVAKRRHYGPVLHYAGRNRAVDLPIKWIDKAVLPDAILRQLTGAAGPDG